MKIPRLRWVIGGMLFLAAILNYIDRQALSILAPTIQRDLKLSDADYGSLANLFLIAYTVAMLLSGRLVDLLGVRLSMALFVSWWSIANMLTATVRSLTTLGACRFMLGLGEAGNWPSSAKAVSEWFPAKERGIAIGFYTMGATVGAMLAPVVVIAIANRWGWQMAFAATGALGLLWVVPWLMIYRAPRNHPNITAAELNLITASAPAEPESPISEWERWRSIVVRKEVWLMMVARMLTDPVWFFYQFWYAKYLFTVRHVEQQDLGITWVVFLAADIGSFGGGFLSAYLIRRGTRPAKSRLWAMLLCAGVMPLAPLVAQMPTVTGSLLFAMLMVLAHLAWLANIGALLVDVIPGRFLATAFGIVATGSALGGIAMNKTVVYLVGNYSYDHWFFIAAVLHPLAWLILWLGGMGNVAGNGEPTQLKASEQAVC